MKKYILLSMFTMLFSAVSSQTTEGVINDYVNAIGGFEKLNKIETVIEEGVATSNGTSNPYITKYIKKENKYKYELVYPYDTLKIVIVGGEGWMINQLVNPVNVTSLSRGQIERSQSSHFPEPFLDYKSNEYQLSYVGREKIRGVDCYKLEFYKKSNSDKEYIYFDVKTKLKYALKTKAENRFSEESVDLYMYYSDYREVEGVKRPFKTESESEGRIIYSAIIKEIKFNKKFSEKEFEIPKN